MANTNRGLDENDPFRQLRYLPPPFLDHYHHSTGDQQLLHPRPVRPFPGPGHLVGFLSFGKHSWFLSRSDSAPRVMLERGTKPYHDIPSTKGCTEEWAWLLRLPRTAARQSRSLRTPSMVCQRGMCTGGSMILFLRDGELR
ncbi:hypothetical protein BDV25DRAFT_153105 [Aspergillus avenaceus]|uniref:Uncharacterized protein n=1 Tax=Aspergillus avenaceus TaxID=36643 RepID=A0A5N6TYR4_ASPAV|nr:hypothetical protein BDV25DRAFT_153105 [Aspergillus avenaceus]